MTTTDTKTISTAIITVKKTRPTTTKTADMAVEKGFKNKLKNQISRSSNITSNRLNKQQQQNH